jgi:hypothetical protein
MEIRVYLKRTVPKDEKSNKQISKKLTSIFALVNYNGK